MWGHCVLMVSTPVSGLASWLGMLCYVLGQDTDSHKASLSLDVYMSTGNQGM